MILESRKIKLKDGKFCTLRSAEPEDSLKILEIMKACAEETDFLMRYPEEIKKTEKEEADFISYMKNSPRNLLILAEVDGEIVAMAGLNEISQAIKVKHRATFGINVLKKYWNNGIATAMIGVLEEKAKSVEFNLMELDVYAINLTAIALYKKLGYERCGKLKNGYRFKNGTYCDNITMYKILN